MFDDFQHLQPLLSEVAMQPWEAENPDDDSPAWQDRREQMRAQIQEQLQSPG